MIKIFAKFMLCISLVLSCGASQAQPAGPSQPPAAENIGGGFFNNLYGAANQIKEKASAGVFDTLFNAGLAFARPTVTWALAAAGSLMLVYLMAETLQFMSGRNGSITQLLFDVSLPAALAAYLILNYENLIMQFAGSSGFLGQIRNIGGDATLTVMDMIGAVLKLISDAISQSWSGLTKAFSVGPNVIGAILGGVADVLGTILFSLVIIALCFSSLAEILGLLLLGPFLCAVGVAFGPIFCASLVTPWTRDYFGKWVGFVVGTAVLTGVLAICISIATSLFATFNFASVAGESSPNATTLLIAAIMLMSVNSLISQAPSIASALVPGSIGASRGSAASIHQGWQTTKGKAAAIGDTAKNVRDRAKDKLDKKKDPPAPNNQSSLDQLAGGKQALKYPTLGLPH